MKEIRYETPIEQIDFVQPTIFLAGPTVRGNQSHLISWRIEAIKLFREKGFKGNLIIPEFTDRTESDKYRYDVPIWEYNGLLKSHVIMFWIPRTRELIGLTTNHEHGYWLAKDREKVVYGRPDNAYRITYLDIMWVEDAKRRHWFSKCPIYNTLDKTINASLKRLTQIYKEPTKSYWVKDDGIHCPICGIEMGGCCIASFCDESKGGCGKWCDGRAKLTKEETIKFSNIILK